MSLKSVIAVALTVLIVATNARAERVSSVRLLPESTAVFLRIADVNELKTQFRATSMGRILNDEQVQPFVGHLYGSILTAYENIEDRVGASLDELLAIPQGEIVFAVITPPAGRPEVVLMLEVDEEQAVPGIMLEQLDDLLVTQGTNRVTEMHNEVEIVVYQPPGDRQRELAVFEFDSTVVLSTNGSLSKELLEVWEGVDDYRPLAENRKFATIMNRCRGTKDEKPAIVWYVDPITMITSAARGSFSGQAGLATMKGLGLDGLKGLGGTIFLRPAELDMLTQTHVMLATPREGVIRMVAFDNGDLTPEPWVPIDVASYMSFQWNIEETYNELQRLFDVFRGDGAWHAEVVSRISEQLNVDFEQDLLAGLEGRATFCAWNEKPARINSQATLVGVRLNEADAFRKTLAKIVAKFPELKQGSTGSVTYYRIDTDQQEVDESFARRPRPCFGIVGDYLLLSDSQDLFEEAVKTKSSGESLADQLDFKLIHSRIERQLKGEKASMIAFQRPEESFRLLHDLASSPTMRDRMRNIENPVVQALLKALEDDPLPPFSVLSQYLAPGGGLLIQDDTGIHYTAFGLARD